MERNNNLGNRIGNLSLKVKIIIILVVVSLIPSALITVSAYRIMTSDLYTQKAENTYTNLSSINQSVNSTVNLRRISAMRTVRNPEIIALLHGNASGEEYEQGVYLIERFFNEYQNTKGVQSIAICSKGGEYWKSGIRPADESEMIEKTERIRQSGSSGVFWEKPSFVEESWTIRFNMPIEDSSSGEIVGLLTIAFYETELESTYTYFETTTEHTLILDQDGTVISAKDKTMIGRDFSEYIETPKTGEAHSSKQIDYNGEQVLYSFIRNEPNGFLIINLGSLSTIGEAQNKLERTFVLVVSLSLLIVLIVSVFLSNNLTRPVNKLVAVIRSMDIENPDEKTQVGFHYSDEIGVIGNAIDEMSKKVRDSSKRLLEEQKAKQEAEVQTLMLQINPHFLYNTLSTVIWMIQSNQKTESIEMLNSLSTMFKLGVNRGKEETSVRNEIDYVRNYLKIQEKRYKDEFSTEISCDPSLEDYRITKLILQPLVENAIYHGSYSEEEPGRIVIRVTEDGNDLLMSVCNSPASLTMGQTAEINEALRMGDDSNFGVGLKNVNKVIRLTYGEGYGVQFEERGNCTAAVVRIPKVL